MKLIRPFASAAILATSLATMLASATTQAQELKRPIHRVANQAAASGAPMRDSNVKPATAMLESPFDLEQQPGEHPLMPAIRLAKQGVKHIDENVQDYSATFTKRERVDGVMGERQQMAIRVRNEPFAIYLKFIQPYAGREVLYADGITDGNIVALDVGLKRALGKLSLDPEGMVAMRGQKYPVTKAGIRNLTTELVERAQGDTKYGECEVSYGTATIDKRPVTTITVVHPVPRRNFDFHKALIFIDNELRIPVAYQAYLWPTTPGGKPVLDEEYIYTNVKINNGFTDADFSPENPAYFQ